MFWILKPCNEFALDRIFPRKMPTFSRTPITKYRESNIEKKKNQKNIVKTKPIRDFAYIIRLWPPRSHEISITFYAFLYTETSGQFNFIIRIVIIIIIIMAMAYVYTRKDVVHLLFVPNEPDESSDNTRTAFTVLGERATWNVRTRGGGGFCLPKN